MKAVWYERTGAAPDVLTFGDMPTPVAGPGEVRVRLEASGVNPADVGRRAGSYRAMEFPRVIPNSDGAGIIDQVGDGVTRLSVGQRVWLFNGQRNGRAFGTAAEYIALAEHLVTPLPDDVSFAAGATLGIPGMTAWCCLFGDGPIAGQTVLVTGGAGAVGHYAVQLAKWGGARVIATVSSSAEGGAGAPGRRRSRDRLQDRGRRRQDDGLHRAARRRSRRRCRFRRQHRNHAEIDGDEFDHRGLRHQRQSQPGGSDARADGEMHRAARAGAVRAAAAVARGSAGRYLEMARRRHSASTTSPRSFRCRRPRRRTSRWKKATSSAPSSSTAREIITPAWCARRSRSGRTHPGPRRGNR